jgi:hypothetical protein
MRWLVMAPPEVSGEVYDLDAGMSRNEKIDLILTRFRGLF